MTKPEAPKYRTKNWSAYNAALKSRGSLLVWFDPDMAWFAGRSGIRGRSDIFYDTVIQFCLMIKGNSAQVAVIRPDLRKWRHCHGAD